MSSVWGLKLTFAIAFVNAVAGDNGDDFSNNLFSDLAPLLALFGEQVAKQFMSQSMGWADNFTFAMAPSGIITAIVGAIRVGGPSWLKAIIGRARENPSAHLGKGRGKDLEADTEFEFAVPEFIIVQPNGSNAPNLSLNLHNRSGTGELHAVAVFGTVLQLGVLMYAGLATYYPRLMLQKGGLPVKDYAFPLTAAGTLILVVGMLICSHVVESSTTETMYRVKPGMEARLLWIQSSQTVSDQSFDSFAIFAKDTRHLITTSRRASEQTQLGKIEREDGQRLSTETQRGDDTAHSFLEILAIIGTIISLCGFIT